MEEVLDMSAENLALLKEEAKMVEAETLFRYIRIFSELSNQVKYSSQKRILIEIALIKLCRPQMERDEASVLERISRIVRRRNPGNGSTGTGWQCSGRTAGSKAHKKRTAKGDTGRCTAGSSSVELHFAGTSGTDEGIFKVRKADPWRRQRTDGCIRG